MILSTKNHTNRSSKSSSNSRFHLSSEILYLLTKHRSSNGGFFRNAPFGIRKYFGIDLGNPPLTSFRNPKNPTGLGWVFSDVSRQTSYTGSY